MASEPKISEVVCHFDPVTGRLERRPVSDPESPANTEGSESSLPCEIIYTCETKKVRMSLAPYIPNADRPQ